MKNTKNNLIRLSDYRGDNWALGFSHDGDNSTLQVHVNDGTAFEIEIVQMNDSNECIRAVLSGQAARDFVDAISHIRNCWNGIV